MRYNFLAFSVIFFLIFSCGEKKNIVKKEVVSYLSNGFLETLPNEEGLISIASADVYTPVFVLSKNNDFIIETRVDYLYYFYVKSEYKDKYKTFNDFLYKSLNQYIRFDENASFYETKFFKVDDTIRENYEKKNFEIFFDSYVVKEKGKIYLNNKKIITAEQYSTVIYYLFINNYYTTKDDNIGRTYVYNWDEKNY